MAARMFRGIEVEDSPPAVANNKETVQEAKSCCRNREEIHRRDRFPVVHEDKVAMSVVRKTSISENYEAGISLVPSEISRFSGGTLSIFTK